MALLERSTRLRRRGTSGLAPRDDGPRFLPTVTDVVRDATRNDGARLDPPERATAHAGALALLLDWRHAPRRGGLQVGRVNLAAPRFSRLLALAVLILVAHITTSLALGGSPGGSLASN